MGIKARKGGKSRERSVIEKYQFRMPVKTEEWAVRNKENGGKEHSADKKIKTI